jgi:hypothetical protein
MKNERIECPEAAMDDYREGVYQYISDASKDAIGFRMRYDISLYTNEELSSLADYWSDRVCEAIAEEELVQAECRKNFEELVKTTIENGAGDRETAIRWLMEAEEESDMWYGEDYFTYTYNLGTNYDIHTGAEKVWPEIKEAA